MAGTTAPRFGITYGWLVADNFKSEMDNNLLKADHVGFHLSVKDRDLATPPGSPANGDTYIVASGGTGAWSGHDGKVVVYNTPTAAWKVYTPRTGWVAFIEDETKLSAYYGSAWSAGISI
jgi:hypothetical protein